MIVKLYNGIFLRKEKKERNEHLLAMGSCSLTTTLIIIATIQQGPSFPISNLITLINRDRAQQAKPSGNKSITSSFTRKK